MLQKKKKLTWVSISGPNRFPNFLATTFDAWAESEYNSLEFSSTRRNGLVKSSKNSCHQSERRQHCRYFSSVFIRFDVPRACAFVTENVVRCLCRVLNCEFTVRCGNALKAWNCGILVSSLRNSASLEVSIANSWSPARGVAWRLASGQMFYKSTSSHLCTCRFTFVCLVFSSELKGSSPWRTHI